MLTGLIDGNLHIKLDQRDMSKVAKVVVVENEYSRKGSPPPSES